MPICKTFSIYCIKCEKNGKVYIGKSADVWSRLRTHYNALSREADGTANFRKQHSDHFINDFKEYGIENFSFRIIKSDIDGSEEAKIAEAEAIEEFNSWNQDHGYNIRREFMYQSKCDGYISVKLSKMIRHRLIDLDQNQSWLIKRVREITGLYFDSGYLCGLLSGKRSSPRIKAAICEILDIKEET